MGNQETLEADDKVGTTYARGSAKNRRARRRVVLKESSSALMPLDWNGVVAQKWVVFSAADNTKRTCSSMYIV